MKMCSMALVLLQAFLGLISLASSVSVPLVEPWPLQYFLFNEEYYVTSACKAEFAECPAGQAGLNLFEHFRNQSQHVCLFPDQFFEQRVPLMAGTEGSLQNCSLPLLDVAVGAIPSTPVFEDLLGSYAEYLLESPSSSDKFRGKMKAFAKKGCKETRELGRFLDTELLDALVVPILNEFPQCDLGSELISTVHSTVKRFADDADLEGTFAHFGHVGYIQLLSNNAAHHSTNASDIQFLLDLFEQFHAEEPRSVAMALDVLAKDLYDAEQSLGRSYHASVYAVFDALIRHLKSHHAHHNALSFVATGMTAEAWLQVHEDTLRLLHQKVVALPAEDPMSAHLFVPALLLGLQDYLSREPARVSLTLVHKIIDTLVSRKQCAATLLNSLLQAYQRILPDGGQWRADDHQSSRETVSLYARSTAVLINTFAGHVNTSHVAGAFVSMLPLTAHSNASVEVLHAVYLLSQFGPVPDNVLELVVPLVRSPHLPLRRVAMKLFHRLADVSNASAEVIRGAMSCADLPFDDKLTMLEVLKLFRQRMSTTDKLAPSLSKQIVRLEAAVKTSRIARPPEQLMELTAQILGYNATDELPGGSFFVNAYRRLLKHADWTLDAAETFVRTLLSPSALTPFKAALRFMGNYQVPHVQVDRQGRTILEILQNTSAETWINYKWATLRDSKGPSHSKSRAVLLDEVRVMDVASLDGSAPVRRSLTAAEKADFLRQLAEIDAIEQEHQFVLLYDHNKVPSSTHSRIGLLWRDDKLIACMPDGVELPMLRNGSTSAKSATGLLWTALQRKLRDELRTPSKVATFQIEVAEERLLHQQLQSMPEASKYFQGFAGKKLSLWNEDDFKAYASSVAHVNSTNLARFVAVEKQLLHHIDSTISVRDAQVMCVLLWYKYPKGSFLQMETGQGKSIVVAMHAAILAKNDRQVDIVTTSPELAIRDTFEFSDFYNTLGLTVAYNVQGGKSTPKPCHAANIVYGDVMAFIGDYLRDISDENVKGGRGFDAVIIDEVDNTLINEVGKKVLQSSPIPGMAKLKGTLVALYTFQAHFFDTFRLNDNTGLICQVYTEILMNETTHQNYTVLHLNESLCFRQDDFKEVARAYIMSWVEEELIRRYSLEQRGAHNHAPPPHLRDFSHKQILSWVNSTLDIRYHVRGYSYLVADENFAAKGSMPHFVITPIDANTGVLQFALTWSDGVHQLLQLREQIALTTDSVTSVFLSYPGYFVLYDELFGLSGTLGTDAHWRSLHEYKDTEVVVIPNFTPKQLTVFPHVLLDDNSTLLLSSIGEAVREVVLEDNRSVIIAVRTAADLAETSAYLRSEGYTKIVEYGGSTNSTDFTAPVDAGTIIIVTPLGGRGTNYKLSQELNENGGLHLIVAYYPASQRVLDQIIGRVARNGDPGSYQMICRVPQQETHFHLSSDDEADWRNLDVNRDKRDSDQQLEDKYINKPRSNMEDAMFLKFVDLQSIINSPTNITLFAGNKTRCQSIFDEQACVFLGQSGEVSLSARSVGTGKYFVRSIENELKSLDASLLRHIKSIVSAANITAKLNYNDATAVHFLLGKWKCSVSGAKTVRRVENAYQSLVPSNVAPSHTTLNLYKAARPQSQDQVHSGWSVQGMADAVMQTVSAWIGRFMSAEERRTAIKLDAERLADIEKIEEVVFLEQLLRQREEFKDAEGNFKEALVTETALMDAKLHHLYQLWLQDLQVYNKKVVNRQLRDHWAFWLKRHRPLLDAMDSKCSHLLLGRLENPLFAQNISVVQSATMAELTSAFEDFRVDMFHGQALDPFDRSGDFYQNSAYLIDLAFEQFEVRDHQARIRDNFGNFLRHWAEDTTAYTPDPLGYGLKCLDRAVEVDPENYATWNARAYYVLATEGPEVTELTEDDVNKATDILNRFSRDLVRSYELLLSLEEERVTMQIVQLKELGLVANDSLLFYQYKAQLEVLRVMTNSAEKNIEKIRNLGEGQMLRIATTGVQTVDLMNMTAITNGTDVPPVTAENGTDAQNSTFTPLSPVLNVMRQNATNVASKESTIVKMLVQEHSELRYIGFTTETYALTEPDEDWWGTVVAFVLGVVQIVVGVVLSTIGGPFLAALGAGLISSGVGDIIASIASVMNGVPIDIDAYLQSKAVTLALILLASGAAYMANFGSAVSTVQKFDAVRAVVKEFAVQLTMMGAGKVIAKVTEDMTYDDDDTHHMVNSAIDALLKEEGPLHALKSLFSADRFHQSTAKMHQLLSAAFAISANYGTEFTEGLKVGGAVASSAAGAFRPRAQFAVGAITTAAAVVHGKIHYDRAAAHFQGRFRDEILAQANALPHRSRQAMDDILSHRFGVQVSSGVTNQLQAGNWYLADSRDIDFKHCERIASVEFGEWKSYQQAAVDACERVAWSMGDEASADQLKTFAASLKKVVHGHIKKDYKSVVSGSISSFATRAVGIPIADRMSDFIDGIIPSKETRDAREKATAEGKQRQADLRKQEKAAFEQGRGQQKTTSQSRPASNKFDIPPDDGRGSASAGADAPSNAERSGEHTASGGRQPPGDNTGDRHRKPGGAAGPTGGTSSNRKQPPTDKSSPDKSSSATGSTPLRHTRSESDETVQPPPYTAKGCGGKDGMAAKFQRKVETPTQLKGNVVSIGDHKERVPIISGKHGKVYADFSDGFYLSAESADLPPLYEKLVDVPLFEFLRQGDSMSMSSEFPGSDSDGTALSSLAMDKLKETAFQLQGKAYDGLKDVRLTKITVVPPLASSTLDISRTHLSADASVRFVGVQMDLETTNRCFQVLVSAEAAVGKDLGFSRHTYESGSEQKLGAVKVTEWLKE